MQSVIDINILNLEIKDRLYQTQFLLSDTPPPQLLLNVINTSEKLTSSSCINIVNNIQQYSCIDITRHITSTEG